jgi:4-hydroxy-tetrahydrodipicolinate synthase
MVSMLVAPYYNRPTQEGIFQAFRPIAEATDRQIVLYSIPGRCGIEIGVPRRRAPPRQVSARAPHQGGRRQRRPRRPAQAGLGNDITVLSGDDSLTLPFMAVGAQGVISVASNLLPEGGRQAREGSRSRTTTPKAREAAPPPLPDLQDALHRAQPRADEGRWCEAGIIGPTKSAPPLCALSAANRQILLKALGRPRQGLTHATPNRSSTAPRVAWASTIRRMAE